MTHASIDTNGGGVNQYVSILCDSIASGLQRRHAYVCTMKTRASKRNEKKKLDCRVHAHI